MVFLTESMFGIPSPPAVRPLEPSASIVKWVRGASCRSWLLCEIVLRCPCWAVAVLATPSAGTTARAVAAARPLNARREGVPDRTDKGGMRTSFRARLRSLVYVNLAKSTPARARPEGEAPQRSQSTSSASKGKRRNEAQRHQVRAGVAAAALPD